MKTSIVLSFRGGGAFITLLLTLSLLLSFNSYAQDVPRLITYQGQISSSQGTLSGEHTITAKLYTNSESTVPIWQGEYSTIATDGIFAVVLGAGKYPLPEPAKLDRQLWIGISVDGGEEMSPRTQLTSSPYALNVPDKSITKAKLSDDVLAGMITKGQDKQIWDNANGGTNNSSPGRMDFLGGGQNNTIITPVPDSVGSWDVIAGGDGNKIDTLTEHNSVGGGRGNTVTANTNFATIPGGDSNQVNSYSGTIGGGGFNNVIGNYGTISGGLVNQVDTMSAIPGGRALKIGRFSFGFNGESDLTKSVDISGSKNFAYLGNLTVLLANTDGTARQIRFYEPNPTVPLGGKYGLGNLGHYSSFQAQSQSADINYLLPPVDGVDGYVLKTNGHGSLYWDNDITDDDWTTTGNTGTVPGPNFLGTINDEAFEIHISNSGSASEGRQRVLRFEPNNTSANIIGGYNGNSITNSVGSYIGSGGASLNINEIDSADFSVIVGGDSNAIFARRSVEWYADYSFIGGGAQNRLEKGNYNVIVGGKNNASLKSPGGYAASYSFIGSGSGNRLGDDKAGTTGYDNIVGGRNNIASGKFSSVVGGDTNSAFSKYSFIGGGDSNVTFLDYSVVGGGHKNNSNGDYATILGGRYNNAYNTEATILNGTSNNALGYASFVGTGDTNRAEGEGSFIGSGKFNIAKNFGFIGSGGGYLTIPVTGGTANVHAGNQANAPGTAIPSGFGLIANGTSQTVVGHYNKPLGNPFTQFNLLQGNDRLFVVGNGRINGTDTNIIRTNGFEISKNGHSIVFHNDSIDEHGNPNPAIEGARYIDNTNIAWGNVSAAGVLQQGFGVQSVSIVTGHTAVYRVFLNYIDPYTGLAVGIVNGSAVTVTVLDPCHQAAATPVQQLPGTNTNYFDVTVVARQLVFQPPNNWVLTCDEAPNGFMFDVLGRP
jgi:hypothetical protein